MNTDKFEELLNKAGLNQVQLANETGVDKVSITRWKKDNSFPKWIEGWLEGRIATNKLRKYVNALDELNE